MAKWKSDRKPPHFKILATSRREFSSDRVVNWRSGGGIIGLNAPELSQNI
jgi:hypothetical protein